jgi:hypothetical protein
MSTTPKRELDAYTLRRVKRFAQRRPFAELRSDEAISRRVYASLGASAAYDEVAAFIGRLERTQKRSAKRGRR